MKLKSKVRSRANPCEMNMKSKGETKSAHKAFPNLGLTGRGCLTGVIRHFLERSVGRAFM